MTKPICCFRLFHMRLFHWRLIFLGLPMVCAMPYLSACPDDTADGDAGSPVADGGDGGTVVPLDAGDIVPDAGGGVPDAGGGVSDAGGGVPDAGGGVPDAGGGVSDAGDGDAGILDAGGDAGTVVDAGDGGDGVGDAGTVTDAGGGDLCSLPLEIGPCEGAFPRYGFNPDTGACELFSYGGCEGNENNFETLEECALFCPSTPGDAGTAIDAGGPDNPICGDGLLGNLEECEDGNLVDDDGCSATCAIEPQCTAGCANAGECMGDETCVGIPNNEAGATGQCEDTSAMPPGVNDPCSLNVPCGDDLVCLGEYLWAEGWCVADWFAKDFYSYDDLAIPDDGSTVTSGVVACGLATVPVDIVVRLHLDHPRPEDLLIELEDPNGQKGIVLNHESWTPGPIVTNVGSGDDTVNGNWTLYVTDTVTGESGNLVGWSVYLLSNWD